MKTATKNVKIRPLCRAEVVLGVKRENFYRIRRGKLRCKNCLNEFKPKLGGLGLSKADWKKIVFWFVLGQPILVIEKQTGVSHYSVIKATNILRQVMIKDVPGIFPGTVEVDETYLGGQKKNKKKSQ